MNVREKYVGQIQIDLEKYAQIKSLFSQVESTTKTKNDLMELTTAVYQIVTDKTYEEVSERKHDILNNERELLLKYFAKGDEHSPRLTSTEIAAEIKRLTGKDININAIGKELVKLGFVRRTTRMNAYSTLKKWLVKKTNKPFEENNENLL